MPCAWIALDLVLHGQFTACSAGGAAELADQAEPTTLGSVLPVHVRLIHTNGRAGCSDNAAPFVMVFGTGWVWLPVYCPTS